MKIEEKVLWTQGLFLQPHHLQVMQRLQENQLRAEREMMMPYAYGLIAYQLDQDSFRVKRITVTRLVAIMPNGEEISMPGNAQIPALDISKELQEHATHFTVSLALPSWSEYDANLAVAQNPSARRIFIEHETSVRDENTGDNEITVVRRRFNARLTTDLRDNTDLQLLPLFQVNIHYKDLSEPNITLETDYIPPYLVLSRDCPLYTLIDDLVEELKQRINRIHCDLKDMGFTKETFSGTNIFLILQLQTLNSYLPLVTACLSTINCPPFRVYAMLKSLLGALSALNPARDISDIGNYDHNNCAPNFQEIITAIRSLIMSEGVSAYIRLDFQKLPDRSDIASIILKNTHIMNADEYFLAVQCDGEQRRLVTAIETGDNLKLVNPSAASQRIRGIKLVEMRYPPRFLPAIPNAIWFKLDTKESPRVWDAICSERGMLLDWAETVFPNLTASLFITSLKKGGLEQ